MTSWVVADSGVFLAVVLNEPYSTQADALIALWKQDGIRIAAPYLFRYEAVAVVRKHVARGTLKPEDGVAALEKLLLEPVKVFMDDDLLRRAYELATRFNRPTTYDSQYLAVAERLGCEFWTADERFFNILTHDLNWVKWVGSFAIP